MAFIIFFFFIEKFEKFEKTGFFRANTQISNLNVLHKGFLLQDWVIRLGSVRKKWFLAWKIELLSTNCLFCRIVIPPFQKS